MEVNAIPLGRVGRLVSARQEDIVGFFIEVHDDRDGETGGLYVFMWSNDDGFDDWLETIDLLAPHFEAQGFEVEWLPPEEASTVQRPHRT